MKIEKKLLNLKYARIQLIFISVEHDAVNKKTAGMRLKFNFSTEKLSFNPDIVIHFMTFFFVLNLCHTQYNSLK